MKAMLLAAGLGLRLRPLTDTLPKAMLPINDKPILERNIEWLKRFGVRQFVINLYHLPQIVIDYFGDGRKWDVEIGYSIETEILGTAGGVKKVAEYFSSTFIIWYADNISTINLTNMLENHHNHRTLASIALYYREDVTQSGIVGLDKFEYINRFVEKPTADQVFSHWVNAGIYIFERDALDLIPEQRPLDFGKEIFPTWLEKGVKLAGYRMGPDEGLWWVDNPSDLARVQQEFKRIE